MGAVKHSTFRRNEELVNRFGYDPYYAGTIVGYDTSEFERLVSHFGKDEAMRMLEEYGDEAFNFLPNKEFGKQNFYLSGPQTSKLTPQNISAYCDMVENGVDWNPFRFIGNVAKRAFNVVTWVPRTIIRTTIAGGKVAVKGAGKLIKIAGKVITAAPYLFGAPGMAIYAADKIIQHKKKTGRKLIPKKEAMRVVAKDKGFQDMVARRTVQAYIDAEDLAKCDADVGEPITIIFSIISFIFPLIMNLIGKKEANPNKTDDQLLAEANNDAQFQAEMAALQARANEPLEEVSGGGWFAKNWWILASGVGAVGIITTVLLVKRSPQRAVADDVGKLVKGSKEAKRYMARIRSMRGKARRRQ
jgi:hypothetical protein